MKLSLKSSGTGMRI